jgi:tryptophan synthase alpha chain
VLDGDVVCSAYQQALRRGTGITDVLRTVEHAASRCPVVVMSYWAPIQQHGPERLAAALATAGAAAVMVPDLPPDASASWERAAAGAGLALPQFIPRTTTERQLQSLCAGASGWLYAPASNQPTGYQGPLDLTALADFTSSLHAASPLPVACGVGISTPALAASVAPLADAVVIGSPIVRALTTDPAHALSLVAQFADAVHATAAEGGSAGHLPRARGDSFTSWNPL